MARRRTLAATVLLAAVVGAAAQGRAALPAGSRMAEPTGRESTFDTEATQYAHAALRLAQLNLT